MHRFMRRTSLLAVFTLVALPALALAQVVEPAPTGFTLEQILAFSLPIAVPALVFVVGAIAKERKGFVLERIRAGIQIAYLATNEFKLLKPGTFIDKAAFAMEQFLAYLDASGIKATPELKTQAALEWKAMHGEEKMAALRATASPT